MSSNSSSPKDGWFTETGVLNSDNVNLSIKVNGLLDKRKSDFQDILLFKNDIFGRCLVLDDAIQCTELDESAYQETISFLPLNSHPDPRRVLIIGGGDGGVAREVSKHPKVQEIIQCEIDEEVVKVSKQYLPFMASGFDSPKLKLLFADGYQYVIDHKAEFDVIITDSSDPKGPAVTLYQKEYYRALYEALRPGGIICCQAESYWFDLPFIKELFTKVKPIFPSVAYASTAVASYPSGQIGFLICSKSADVNFGEPLHVFTAEDCDQLQLKYYSAAMHRSAFTLPLFVHKELNKT
ncbi:PREDICTED: spermidine synthase-like [Rhagoletis zephyria]|uniref:spermidine synthase-like n=1 Tax=Rhagoletis zephyria TaxID=28612 RepID=UPI0008119A80|nr:PREDICTED: spermidine synthase-like [Rhagoletis zephyria]KAH9394444.1 hypothetical protein TYRP_004496 [Tyrophagus putrescentiae]